jgi:hypothetical protein
MSGIESGLGCSGSATAVTAVRNHHGDKHRDARWRCLYRFGPPARGTLWRGPLLLRRANLEAIGDEPDSARACSSGTNDPIRTSG